MPKIGRRDFLKLGAMLAGGTVLSSFRLPSGKTQQDSSDKPNIILLLFDAMSARHLSVYGYPRRTTPNFERFAERATVYHSHYSGGSFTIPGTASMLTGFFPWRHRALNYGGLVRRDLESRNIFSFLGPDYTRAAYAQNAWAQLLVGQFRDHIDRIMPLSLFSHQQRVTTAEAWFPNDPVTAYHAYQDLLATGQQSQGSVSASLVLRLADFIHKQSLGPPTSLEYPRGFPTNGFYYYKLAETFDGVRSAINSLSREVAPFIGYFHLWSPHEPFAPHRDFVGRFNKQDPGIPPRPLHPLATNRYSYKELLGARTGYDEYIASVDLQFGRLVEELDQDGVLDNTYFIVTADHGQLFERGEYGHLSPLLFDPVIHIPLLISSPSQRTRKDVHALTSNADLLPTILNMGGRPIPQGLDGMLLPGLGGQEVFDRPIISVDAKENAAVQTLKRATVSLRKGEWKLTGFFGYEKVADSFEMYNLASDPFEEKNLILQEPARASRLKEELLFLRAEADLPYD